jgi:hypothetical protein
MWPPTLNMRLGRSRHPIVRPFPLAFYFHQASIAAFNGAQLWMVADLRKLFANSIDYVEQEFTCLCFIVGIVDNYL